MFIEEYKFETGVILYMSLFALALPLASSIQTLQAQERSRAALASGGFISAVTSTVDGTVHAQEKPAASYATAHQTGTAIVWPLNGRITTEYGVPHRPWQHRHTGIDITSAQPAGSAAIVPFSSGTVIRTIHSPRGYGKHVIIDHGQGVSSLYGHLARITVFEGQQVQPGDIIGYEGSTGSSTGPHLHFEIRQDNIPIDPRQFVSGSPL